MTMSGISISTTAILSSGSHQRNIRRRRRRSCRSSQLRLVFDRPAEAITVDGPDAPDVGNEGAHDMNYAAPVLRERADLLPNLDGRLLHHEHASAPRRWKRWRRSGREGGEQEGDELSPVYHLRGSSISSDGFLSQSRSGLRQYSSTRRSMQFMVGPASQHLMFGGSP